LRIAAITASFLPQVGGAEFAVHHLARHWAGSGHDVTVFNLSADAAVHPDANYAVRRYTTLRGSWRFGHHRQPFSWYVGRQLARHLRTFRPDVISAHFGYPVAIWLSRLRPVPPYVVTCHGPALHDGPGSTRERFGLDPLLTRTFARAAGVIAISSHARRQLLELGVAADKIFDIPNGVEAGRFARKVEGFDLRQRLGLPRDALVVLSVGREIPEKAYHVGIDAFALAAAGEPRLHYAIVARGAQIWAERARERGVGDRVHFQHGLHGDELVGAYQQADIFMLSSVRELCALVVPEAMAAGLPEVVTNVSGAQDMVVDGENGLVVEPGRAEPLGAALARLAADSDLRARMSAAGLARSKRYDWGVLAARYLEHLPRIPR
jgi:glycosyltransferase involved in cell wall biosynthesis